MKKWQKKVAIILMSMGIYFSTAHSLVAHATNIPPSDIVPMEHYFWGGYRKEVIRTYHEWGGYKQVSDYFDGPGSVSANRSLEISATVSGEIFGINISLGSTYKTSLGYTLSTNDAGTYYLGHKVLFRIKEGYRIKDDVFGGQQKNYYKVKVPIGGHYSLIRAW